MDLFQIHNFGTFKPKIPSHIIRIIFKYIKILREAEIRQITSSIEKGYPFGYIYNPFGIFLDNLENPRVCLSIYLGTNCADGLYWALQCEAHGYHRREDCFGCFLKKNSICVDEEYLSHLVEYVLNHDLHYLSPELYFDHNKEKKDFIKKEWK
jgi:hypothetical protein